MLDMINHIFGAKYIDFTYNPSENAATTVLVKVITKFVKLNSDSKFYIVIAFMHKDSANITTLGSRNIQNNTRIHLVYVTFFLHYLYSKYVNVTLIASMVSCRA